MIVRVKYVNNSTILHTHRMAKSMMTITNRPNVTNWNMETGYNHDVIHDNTYPLLIFNSRSNSALDVGFVLERKDFGNICPNAIPGVKFFVTSPGEVTITSRKHYNIPMEEEIRILIKPTLITTTNGLRSYDPNRRQCFFQSDRQLRFFRIYTQNNCEAECLANFTKIQCGCARFSMPSTNHHLFDSIFFLFIFATFSGDNLTKICGTARIECYTNAEQQIYGEDVIDGLKNEAAKTFRRQCNCRPSCTSIKYDVDIDRINSFSSKINR